MNSVYLVLVGGPLDGQRLVWEIGDDDLPVGFTVEMGRRNDVKHFADGDQEITAHTQLHQHVLFKASGDDSSNIPHVADYCYVKSTPQTHKPFRLSDYFRKPD